MPSTLNQYRFLRTLGKGSYSKVKLALDTLKKEEVAIKIHKTKAQTIQDSETETTIKNELDALFKLTSHQHIIKLIDFIKTGTVMKDNGESYEVKFIVVEEYAPEGELQHYVQ